MGRKKKRDKASVLLRGDRLGQTDVRLEHLHSRDIEDLHQAIHIHDGQRPLSLLNEGEVRLLLPEEDGKLIDGHACLLAILLDDGSLVLAERGDLDVGHLIERDDGRTQTVTHIKEIGVTLVLIEKVPIDEDEIDPLKGEATGQGCGLPVGVLCG